MKLRLPLERIVCEGARRRASRKSLLDGGLLVAILAGLIIWWFGPDAPANAPQDDRETLAKRQQELAAEYRSLEEKLFQLHEIERASNPDRSRLLQQALVTSQQRKTLDALAGAADALQKGKFADAEKLQQRVAAELTALIELLQSEVSSRSLRDALKRHLEYAQEIERLSRLQRNLLARLEQKTPPDELSIGQSQTAERTRNLTERIRRDEQGFTGNPSVKFQDPTAAPSDPTQRSQATEREAANLAADALSAPSLDNPVLQRVQAAEEQMREAAGRLNERKLDPAADSMQQAERELAEAKRQLDEILRQMREEEQTVALTRLEERFRRMLERQLKVNEQTERIDRIPDNARLTDFEITCRKLVSDEREILAEADNALALLREDGTAVAIPEAVDQIRRDLQQIIDQLTDFKTGAITRDIQQEVVETLTYLVAVMEKAQEDLQNEIRRCAEGEPGSAQPGEQPLVQSLAELKLIRRLQERIHVRHRRYAELLDDPGDSVGRASRQDVREALQRLAAQQQELVEVAREIELRSREKE